jgi:hypothetical protein
LGYLKRICVIDGQGGGIGANMIRFIKTEFRENVETIALGTNAIATAQMLKAGANKGASGENAICRTVANADFIVGPIAITWSNAMTGELTPPNCRIHHVQPGGKDSAATISRESLYCWVGKRASSTFG